MCNPIPEFYFQCPYPGLQSNTNNYICERLDKKQTVHVKHSNSRRICMYSEFLQRLEYSGTQVVMQQLRTGSGQAVMVLEPKDTMGWSGYWNQRERQCSC